LRPQHSAFVSDPTAPFYGLPLQNFSGWGLAGATVAGAITGSVGTVATAIAGAVGMGGALGTALVNAAAGAVGALLGAAMDPCLDASGENLATSAVAGAVGGPAGNKVFPTKGMKTFGQKGFPRTWSGVVPQVLGGNAGSNAMNAVYRGGTVAGVVGSAGPVASQSVSR